ncbi:MAG: elongation factor P maturation arginine rhamnosyltransferase EarP [Betaproteobacteria bacterium]|nr:elongation factor P maturation arginine rhamnosyltransferase EarP [Betaproteobacteria bacterium]
MRWEIFCEVIDNHGDLGVSLRLARDLAARGETVRLWVDDASALTWMAPDLVATRGTERLQVLDWPRSIDAAVLHTLREAPADVLVETFGCNPPAAFIDAWSQGHAAHAPAGTAHGVWINLEYLSAESFVERQHGLASPVSRTPAVRKFFYHPGWTAATGGLLREPSLLARQQHWQRAALRRQWSAIDDEWLVSLFCYEPAALPDWLACLAARAPHPAPDRPVRLLITPGRAAAAADAALKTLARTRPRWNDAGRLRLQHLPWLSQDGYDQLLWACDCNFVRGEDSLVRAIWSGRPWVWQLYEQTGDAHHAKLQALLHWADTAAGPAPASWRSLMQQWNGLAPQPAAGGAMPDIATMAGWQAWAMRLREHLLAHADLTSALIGFVLQKR